MSSEPVIYTKNLQKVFHVYPSPAARLKQFFWGERRQLFSPFAALRSIDLEVKRGDVVGIIGRNGSGKSTLLQLLCGTLTPSAGEVAINGRIAALLELGAGFNPEFTGRENIYLSASLLGYSREETDKILGDIIEFSGIGPFIDQPVKTYSSGMFVRLAFSVATSVDPDILVIDEALSVGDGDFSKRSFDRIMKMKEQGKTIIFCSHSLYQIEVLCNRVIWIDKGRLVADGSPEKVVPQYQSYLDRLGDAHGESVALGESKSGAYLCNIDISSGDQTGSNLTLRSGVDDLDISIEFETKADIPPPGVAVVIHTESGILVTSCGTWDDKAEVVVNSDGAGRVNLRFLRTPLLKGRYRVGVILFCEKGLYVYDEVDPVAHFNVTQESQARGLMAMPRYWRNETPPCGNNTPDNTRLSAPEGGKASTSSTGWQVREASNQDMPAILELFKRCFGYEISSNLWLWKYPALQAQHSTVVEQEGQIIAFYGAMPRRGLVMGRPVSLVQVGDVMVAPEVRGILTRRGPFYLSAYSLLSKHIGPEKTYPFTFGFPNKRHVMLGIRRKLYCEVDKIISAQWKPKRQHWRTLGWREASLADTKLIDRIWEKMAEHCKGLAIGVRDSEWIVRRYFDHPEGNYKLYIFYGRLSGRVKGISVFKHCDDNSIELMDLISTPDDAGDIVRALQHIADANNFSHISAWVTPSVLAWFQENPPECEQTDIVVPGSAVNDKEYALKLKGKWWLMGGDTDSH
ncbi:GNAT family N-acetyltransferase [Pseudomonadota bacterium 24LQ007]